MYERAYGIGWQEDFTEAFLERLVTLARVVFVGLYVSDHDDADSFMQSIRKYKNYAQHVVLIPLNNRKLHLAAMISQKDTPETACILTTHAIKSNFVTVIGPDMKIKKSPPRITVIKPKKSELFATPLPSIPELPHSNCLQRANSHPRDATISFDEATHTYSVDWDGSGTFSSTNVISVSAFYGHYFPKFDTDASIATMMKGKRWCPSHYCWGLSPDEIKAKWAKNAEEASSAGTAHHLICEKYYNGCPPTMPFSKAVAQFLQFTTDHSHLVPFRTEWVLRSDKMHYLCGTIDMMFVSKDHDENQRDVLTLSMYDWKNSKSIKKFAFNQETGFPPFDDVPNANFYKYAAQLNVYKYLLENFYRDVTYQDQTYKKIFVDEMYIVVMHENRDEYQKMAIPDYQDKIQQIFDLRKHDLSQCQKKGTK